MKTPRTQLATMIANKTLAGSFEGAEITSLAAYLLDEGRVSELGSLLRDVQKAWADRGVVEVVAYSAHALPANATSEIEALARRVYPNAKQIIVTPKLDPSLIGGVRLELADYQLDRTTKAKLQQFKTLAMSGKE
jgi:F-type H+-transporting ATPase subunit delta